MSESGAQDAGPVGVLVRTGAVTVLNGVGQIYFQSNPWCGACILAAFAVADWRMALLGLLGLAASTGAGALLRGRFDAAPGGADLRAGVQGFCGILVGAAVFAMLGAGVAGTVSTILGGLACAPLTVGMRAMFGSGPLARFALPATTAPFCIVAEAIHYITVPLQPESPELAEVHGGTLVVTGHAIVTGISQVVFIDSVPAGLLILVGLTIAHWKVGAAAVLGSAVAAGFALVIGEAPLDDYHGLDSYSSVLVAIAMACVFVSGRWAPLVLALVGAVLAVLLERAMLEVGIPLFTWPYVVVTWALLVTVAFAPIRRRAS